MGGMTEMVDELDYAFRSMGSEVRLVIGSPLLAGAPAPLAAADRERTYVWNYAARLSRFDPGSELSALNNDARSTVPASPLLRTAVRAGLWAAERTGGLVVPTLTGELERLGYDHSLDRVAPASLEEALDAAPERRPAQPDPRALWRQVEIDDQAGTIMRPPGVLLDTGGTGKGLCADAVGVHLRGYTRYVIDCGGDIAVGGVGAQLKPFSVEVEHPLTGTAIAAIPVSSGAIATSGLNVRIWRRADGTFAHHLLDPATGQPVWSGLIAVTALAPSALEAETLAKLALLLGPDGARTALAEHGGVLVHDDGGAELVGPTPLLRARLLLSAAS